MPIPFTEKIRVTQGTQGQQIICFGVPALHPSTTSRNSRRMAGLIPLMLCAVVSLLSAFSVSAQNATEVSPVTATLVSNANGVSPGKPLLVGLLLKMAPGWHTYYRDPGDSGLATSIQWELPEGFSAGEIQWPAPVQETEPGNFKVNVYKEEVLLPVTVTPPATLKEARVTLRARVKWLACKESCIPGGADLSLSLPVSQSTQPASPELFQKYQGKPGSGITSPVLQGREEGFWRYLFFAFIGGLILNFMPCVLPVISLKILGFLRHGQESPGKIRFLGFMYGFGVLSSFVLLAGFVIAAQRAGELAGWGLQFQSPVFVVIITTLVTLVSLNLFGVFEITLGSSTLSAVSGLASKQGGIGAFLNGVFAVILATPCTAPFLGAALGFAFLQPPAVVVLFFLTVGVGLALPYVLICSFPGLIRFLPKPGSWMERFKVAMGFPMLATAVWLFSVAIQHYAGKTLWLGLFLVILAMASWIYGEFVQRSLTHRGLAAVISFLLVAGAYGFALEHQLHWRNPEVNPGAGEFPATAAGTGVSDSQKGQGIDWKPWSPEAVELARSQGSPVLVDFTADWCLTCQTNKVTSLEIPSVREELKQHRFVAFLGDYTRKNDAITRELKRFKRAGVPLVVVYPVTGDPIVLPELLTPTVVLDAIKTAASN